MRHKIDCIKHDVAVEVSTRLNTGGLFVKMPAPNRNGLKIVSLEVKDVRFPTSLGGHGSDALVSKLDF